MRERKSICGLKTVCVSVRDREKEERKSICDLKCEGVRVRERKREIEEEYM